MAICRDGYSSHCSFIERHKALVAACDICKKKTGPLRDLLLERGFYIFICKDKGIKHDYLLLLYLYSCQYTSSRHTEVQVCQHIWRCRSENISQLLFRHIIYLKYISRGKYHIILGNRHRTENVSLQHYHQILPIVSGQLF